LDVVFKPLDFHHRHLKRLKLLNFLSAEKGTTFLFLLRNDLFELLLDLQVIKKGSFSLEEYSIIGIWHPEDLNSFSKPGFDVGDVEEVAAGQA